MLSKIKFFIEIVMDWYYSQMEYPPFDSIILTEGWLEDPSQWKEVARHMIGKRFFVVYERISGRVKEVRWFETHDQHHPTPVFRTEVPRLLSLKGSDQE